MYYYLLYYVNLKNGVKDSLITHKLSRRYLNKLIKMLAKDNIIVVSKQAFLRVSDAKQYDETSDFDYDGALKRLNHIDTQESEDER